MLHSDSELIEIKSPSSDSIPPIELPHSDGEGIPIHPPSSDSMPPIELSHSDGEGILIHSSSSQSSPISTHKPIPLSLKSNVVVLQSKTDETKFLENFVPLGGAEHTLEFVENPMSVSVNELSEKKIQSMPEVNASENDSVTILTPTEPTPKIIIDSSEEEPIEISYSCPPTPKVIVVDSSEEHPIKMSRPDRVVLKIKNTASHVKKPVPIVLPQQQTPKVIIDSSDEQPIEIPSENVLTPKVIIVDSSEEQSIKIPYSNCVISNIKNIKEPTSTSPMKSLLPISLSKQRSSNEQPIEISHSCSSTPKIISVSSSEELPIKMSEKSNSSDEEPVIFPRSKQLTPRIESLKNALIKIASSYSITSKINEEDQFINAPEINSSEDERIEVVSPDYSTPQIIEVSSSSEESIPKSPLTSTVNDI